MTTPKTECTWPLANGLYETQNGSRVEIFGKHSGGSRVDFDWLEEGGCIDCQPNPYPEEYGDYDVRLVWNCEFCGEGSAKLYKVEVPRRSINISQWQAAVKAVHSIYSLEELKHFIEGEHRPSVKEAAEKQLFKLALNSKLRRKGKK